MSYRYLNNMGLTNSLFGYSDVAANPTELQRRCYSEKCTDKCKVSYVLKNTRHDYCPDCNRALVFKRVSIQYKESC